VTADGERQRRRPRVACALTRGAELTEHDKLVLTAFTNYLRNQPAASQDSGDENPVTTAENAAAETPGHGAAAEDEQSSAARRRAADPGEQAAGPRTAPSPAGLAGGRDDPDDAASETLT
jgi:hypothetical protein